MMATSFLTADLPQLIQAATQVTDQVQREFGLLTVDQLNWKPNPDEWSIGQCLDHLIVTNTLYFATFQQALDGTHQPTFWARLPGLPTFFGNFLIKTLDPDNAQRVEAPKVFLPTSSTVSTAILATFVSQQARLIDFMQASVALPVERIILTSPAATWLTYPLMAAYRIIVVHEQRHLRQMQQVQALPAFAVAVV